MSVKTNLLILAVCASEIAHADNFILFAGACVTGASAAGNCNYTPLSGGTNASISSTFEGLTANAQAVAGYTKLGAAVSGTYSSATPKGDYSYGLADVLDSITVTAPGMNGKAGSLSVYYTLDGTISTTGPVSAFTEVVLESYGQNFFYSTVYNSSYSGTVLAGRLPFTFGTPFTWNACLGATIGTGIIPSIGYSGFHVTTDQCSGQSGPSSAGSGTGTADFLNTMSLSLTNVTDVFGNPVSGAQILGASGTVYNAATSIPEPGLLAGFGLLVIGASRRIFRRS